MPKLKIAVLVDPEAIPPDDPHFEHGEGLLSQEVEFHVAETLREMDHHVAVMPFQENIHDAIDSLRAYNPELIFNLTEHHGGDRRKDQHIVSLLELLDFRYTGTGPEGMILCRDKALGKAVLRHYGITVPDFVSIPPGKRSIGRPFPFPAIVKPRFEDGSDGISLRSLVSNREELEDRVALVHKHMRQPAICEEYIEGREIYVGITGNGRLTSYPAREVRFDGPMNGPRFATSRVKLDEKYRQKWKIDFTDARLGDEMDREAGQIGKQIYRILQIRDFGRIDMRITKDNQFVFLEANPNPDLTMGDEIAEAAEKSGVSYEQLVSRILRHAWSRYENGKA